MNNNLSDVLLALQQRGLIDTNATANQATEGDDQQDTPWFIQVLFGFSGIIASLLFIGFLTLLLFTTDFFNSSISLLITGLFLSGIGFILFKNQRLHNNAFISSVAFAISIAGQAYMAFALFSKDLPHPLDIWLCLLVQGGMTLIIPNQVYRILSSIVTLSLIVYLLNYYQVSEFNLGLLALITIVSHLQGHSLLQHIPTRWRAGVFDAIKAIGYASALMLLAVSVYFIAAEYGHGIGGYAETLSYNYYLAQVLLILASLYAAYLILQRYQIKILSALGLTVVSAMVILGMMSVYVSGLLATSLIIIIATANSQRVLLALGIIALVGYVFWYYYQLDTSLLIKSISMLIIGITMLLMRWLLLKRYTMNNKELAR